MSTLAADVLAGLAPDLSLRGATGRAIARLDRYRFLLLLRFALINFTGFALLAAAWLQGWIAQILAADDTHICKLIFVLFLAGLALSAQKVWMLSRELNEGEQRRLVEVAMSELPSNPNGSGGRRS